MFRVNRCAFTSGSSVAAYFYNQQENLGENTSTVSYETMKLATSDLEFANTSLTYAYKALPNTSSSSSTSAVKTEIDALTFADFSQNKNFAFDATKKINASGTTTYSANNFYLRAFMKTTDAKISPTIDLSRLNLVVIENKVNDGSLANSDFQVVTKGSGYTSVPTVTITAASGDTGSGATGTSVLTSEKVTSITVTDGGTGYYKTPTVAITGGSGTGADVQVLGETGKAGGNAQTRYITRRVTLQDGFDAGDVRVYVDAYKPTTSEIMCYYKVKADDDADDFDDKSWALMTQETDTKLFSTDEDDFNEYAYRTSGNTASYTSSSVTYDDFKTFSVKVVLATSTPYDPPRVRDLRVIALDS